VADNKQVMVAGHLLNPGDEIVPTPREWQVELGDIFLYGGYRWILRQTDVDTGRMELIITCLEERFDKARNRVTLQTFNSWWDLFVQWVQHQ